MVAFSTCQTDTASHVVDTNDDYPGCSTSSKLQLHILENTLMYLVVTSSKDASSSNGRFRLVVNEYEQTNINCQSALNISSFPAVVEGTTAGADSVKLECTVFNSPKGLWYTFIGDGSSIVADTCSSDLPFDVYLIVIKGGPDGDCNGMECYLNEDGGCPGSGDIQARVYWKTEVGQQYMIFVTSYYANTGTFQLTIRTLEEAIPTICEQAMSITNLPFSQTFPLNSSWHKTPNICSETQLSFTAAFFTFKGIGASVTLHTCNSNSGSTEIEIIDSCENTECVAKSSVYCGLHSYIEFMAENGREYYIRAYCSEASCDLTFVAEYTSTSNHDMCQSALTVTSAIQETVSVSQLTSSSHGCDGYVENGKGKWYKFIGTEALPNKKGYHIFSYDENGDSPNYIEVHSGCSNYYCLNNQRQEVLIDIKTTCLAFASAGESQWLSVDINIEDNIEHETCLNAKSEEIPFNLLDWNLNAAKSKKFCSSTEETEGIWYVFTFPTTSTIYVSTCSNTIVYDSYLAIGSGSCSSLSCLAEVDDTTGCNGGGKTSFEATYGNHYYVFVGSGSVGTTGQFMISAYTTDIPETSKCNSAYVIPLDKSFVRFTTFTHYAYVTTLTLPDEIYAREFKGTYLLINEGYVGEVTVMTCATGTEIPTLITVHDTCRTNLNSNYSFPSTSIDYTTYTSHSCSEYGSLLTVSFDGYEPKMIFVGGYFTENTGFIDIELLISATPIDQSSSSSTSSTSSSVPSSESSSSINSEHIQSDEPQNSVPVFWIIFGVCCFVLFVLNIALLIVMFVIKHKTVNSSYQTLEY
ncbi:Uncharacterized protein QTN25_000751 [Entamoeba marina]